MDLDDWAAANTVLYTFKDCIHSMIGTDFKEAKDTVPHQSTIYHYTDVRGALGILQSGELWFTERAHLNDPVEMRYGLSIGHELFETAVENRGAAIPGGAASRLKREHELGLTTYGFWSFSASLDGNDLSQWRNYADDGRGVCLGFSLENFNMIALMNLIPDVSNNNSLRFPVNYVDGHLRTHLQAYIDRGIGILEALNLSAQDRCYEPYGRYERKFLRILNDGFYVNSVLSKHPAYAHEKEYRLLISGIRNAISACDRHCLRERNGEIVGYLKLPVPTWKQPGVLTHIRLGPAAPDQLEDQLRMTLTTLAIPLPRIDKSDIPYRSTR